MEIPKELLSRPALDTPEGVLFERMRKAAFEPLKNIIEYEKLHNSLDVDDVHRLAHAITDDAMTWCKWLQHLDKQRKNGRD